MESTFATRKVGKNARGVTRRVGKGKRCSGDTSEFNPRIKKARNDETDPKFEGNKIEPSVCADSSQLPGAYRYFESQRVGSKGIRQQIKAKASLGEGLEVTHAEYIHYITQVKYLNPSQPALHNLRSLQLKSMTKSLWLSLVHHNILLYGLGNKKEFMREIMHSCLHGEDVLELDGSAPTQTSSTIGNVSVSGDRCIRSLLLTLASAVLRIKDLPSYCAHLPSLSQLISGNEFDNSLLLHSCLLI